MKTPLVGGAIVEDEQRLDGLIDTFSHIAGSKMLVHGGGRSATRIATALGIESKMADGRRITDGKTLEVVTMVYGGLVNKNIVAHMQSKGMNALGLTGADLNIVRAHRRPLTNGIDYGYVGDIDSVDTNWLSLLIKQGVVPVVAPLTHDGKAQMLNTNADTMAAETAKALATDFEVTLIFAFEQEGVLDAQGNVVSHIDRQAFEAMKADNTISGGMIPKIENALSAVEAGVSKVVITNASHIDKEKGTTIS